MIHYYEKKKKSYYFIYGLLLVLLPSLLSAGSFPIPTLLEKTHELTLTEKKKALNNNLLSITPRSEVIASLLHTWKQEVSIPDIITQAFFSTYEPLLTTLHKAVVERCTDLSSAPLPSLDDFVKKGKSAVQTFDSVVEKNKNNISKKFYAALKDFNTYFEKEYFSHSTFIEKAPFNKKCSFLTLKKLVYGLGTSALTLSLLWFLKRYNLFPSLSFFNRKNDTPLLQQNQPSVRQATPSSTPTAPPTSPQPSLVAPPLPTPPLQPQANIQPPLNAPATLNSNTSDFFNDNNDDETPFTKEILIQRAKLIEAERADRKNRLINPAVTMKDLMGQLKEHFIWGDECHLQVNEGVHRGSYTFLEAVRKVQEEARNVPGWEKLITTDAQDLGWLLFIEEMGLLHDYNYSKLKKAIQRSPHRSLSSNELHYRNPRVSGSWEQLAGFLNSLVTLYEKETH